MESDVKPASSLVIGAASVPTQSAILKVNKPAWPWFLLAMLVFLILEWIVYNKRVFI